MTDSSSLVPNQQAVSSDCLFNLKPSSVPGRSYRASIPTSNKSVFNPSDVAILYIPGGRRNTFLDPSQSYIKYTINNNDTVTSNAYYVDGVGSCVINRLDSFSGSNLLETVQGYNILYSYLTDFQMNWAARYGASANYGTSVTAASIRAGAKLTPASSASKPCKLTVCMPLLSAVYGLGADKMLPIGLLGDDIRIEISFESLVQGMVADATTAPVVAWTVTNVELELCIIELSDVGMAMVNSVTPFNQPIYLHGNTWRHYASSLAVSQTGNYSTLVPARFASLKTLVLCPRCNTQANGATSYSISSRCNPNITQYWWRIGPYLIPNKPVNLLSDSLLGGYAEGYMETLRSFHTLSHADPGSSITFDEYNVLDNGADAFVGNGGAVANATANNSYKNAFAIGQELEMWAMRSDVLISGMNTLASQVFFECNLSSNTLNAAYTLDFFANADIIYVLENGLLSARY
jgi:hypothetical protein